MMLSTFETMLFFGNMVTFIEDLQPILKSKMQKAYNYAKNIVINLKSSASLEAIDHYYSYLWDNSVGLNENEILNFLPPSIRSDLLYQRYEKIIDRSPFFRVPSSGVDIPLICSILQFISFGIIMPNHCIFVAGTCFLCIIFSYTLLRGSLQ